MDVRVLMRSSYEKLTCLGFHLNSGRQILGLDLDLV